MREDPPGPCPPKALPRPGEREPAERPLASPCATALGGSLRPDLHLTMDE